MLENSLKREENVKWDFFIFDKCMGGGDQKSEQGNGGDIA